jgi:hypothetical protein
MAEKPTVNIDPKLARQMQGIKKGRSDVVDLSKKKKPKK